MAAAHIQDLSVSYRSRHGSIQALDRVSLAIAPGERLGLIGESGCGKSTLSAVLGRLLPRGTACDAAALEVAGQPLPALAGEALRRFRHGDLAYIYQDPLSALDPTKTIGRQMDLLAEARLTASARQAALESVGIRQADRVLRAYPHQLSGGMAQRAVIAMALLRHPKLLVADEPTGSLDASIRREVMELIVRRCREIGAAILFISHDLPLVARYTDRVAVMYAGRIVELRRTEAFFAAPLHPYSAALLAAEPGREPPGGRIEGLAGAPPSLAGPWAACAFEPRCRFAEGLCQAQRPEPLPAPEGSVTCLRLEEIRAGAVP